MKSRVKEEKRESLCGSHLDGVAVRQAVIPEDIAVVPEFLNERGNGHEFINTALISVLEVHELQWPLTSLRSAHMLLVEVATFSLLIYREPLF